MSERSVPDLTVLSLPALDEYLRAHSLLPGPRANLTLVTTLARTGSRPAILHLVGSDDEFLRMCGTAGVGTLLLEDPDDAALLEVLRVRATDALWRVREATAIALQLIGEKDPALLRAVVARWVGDTHSLVRRAALSGICEPRLLRDDVTRSAALEACRVCTDSIRVLPAGQRKDPDLRTLRTALGYCWSVAIAASPAAGLAAFRALAESDDPDIAWIVASNSRKVRLSRLLHPT